HKVRVIAPDVGGGFGTKANGYPEDLLIPAAAIASRRPVKWIETRREHMIGSAHARGQVHDIEIAATRDGRMLAVRDRIWVELGIPYRDGNPLVYDSGDFRAALDAALDAVDYDALRKEQAALRERGIYRGIGISGYVEGTAIGPTEGATVRLDASGHAVVATG